MPHPSTFLPRAFFHPVYAALFCLLSAAAVHAAPPDPGIAVAVVFDTSGSMNRPLPAKAGAPADTKFHAAQRALGLVIDRLESFSKNPGALPLAVSITVFRGNDAAVVLPLAPLNPRALRTWLASARIDGATPLGEAIHLAGQQLLAAPASSRHLLILTDGANSVGRTPEAALTQLNRAAAAKQFPVFTHIIALDISPAIFAGLKKQGATLIGASDEAQLNAQFDFILEEKILLEAPRQKPSSRPSTP